MSHNSNSVSWAYLVSDIVLHQNMTELLQLHTAAVCQLIGCSKIAKQPKKQLLLWLAMSTADATDVLPAEGIWVQVLDLLQVLDLQQANVCVALPRATSVVS